MRRSTRFASAPPILALLLICIAPLHAQQTPASAIRGRITDSTTKQPISGVTVSVEGRSTLTQPDGRFVITGVASGAHTVRTRIIGYAPASRDVTVTDGQTVDADLTMAPQAIGLSEVVVVGYGEQRAGNITGAVTQMDSAAFNRGRLISPEQLIQSKIPGVQVVDNNEPGGGMSIRIRGATSLDASSEPLYVIDGVPLGIASGPGGGLSAGRNPLNFINPNDIETITVLREDRKSVV